MLCENRSDCPQCYPSYNEHGHLHTALSTHRTFDGTESSCAPSILALTLAGLPLLPTTKASKLCHLDMVFHWCIWWLIHPAGESCPLSPRSYSLMASLDWAGCLRSCTLFHRAKRAKCYRQLCPSFFREVGGNARKNLFIIRAPPRSSAMAQLKSHSHNHARLSAVISFPHS